MQIIFSGNSKIGFVNYHNGSNQHHYFLIIFSSHLGDWAMLKVVINLIEHARPVKKPSPLGASITPLGFSSMSVIQANF